MIDLMEFFKSIGEFFENTLELKETIKKPISSRSAFKEILKKIPITLMGLGYIASSFLMICGEILSHALSNPHQLAVLATICPPILSTIVYTIGTFYQITKMILLSLKKNPHEKESPLGREWQKNHRIEMVSRAISASACIVLLVASLSPIPGAPNFLGLGILGGLIVFDLFKFTIKRLNQSSPSKNLNSKSLFQDTSGLSDTKDSTLQNDVKNKTNNNEAHAHVEPHPVSTMIHPLLPENDNHQDENRVEEIQVENHINKQS